MKELSVKIESNKEIMPGVFRIALRSPTIASEAKPGQFIMVDCGERFTLRRPISIHNVKQKNEIELLVRVTGKGTDHIIHRKKAETLNIIGPLGNGFSINSNSKNFLLVAGGIGIAPLVFLANQAYSQGKKVTLLLGFAQKKQVYPVSLLPRNIEILISTEDGSLGKKGMITDFVSDYLNNNDQVFACGPVPMYRTLTNILKSQRFEKLTLVSLEVRMGCGLGICNSCTIKTRHGIQKVCTDGPIFELHEIDWDWVKV